MALTLSYTAAAQLPSVKLENRKGEVVNTSSLVDGKTPMIISFWAVTCKPCIQELDAINDAMPDWLDEASFRVVAISTDDSRFSAQARAWVEGHGWSDFTVLFDKNKEFMVKAEDIKSKCGWSPFEGETLKGVIEAVLVEGEQQI